MSGTLVLPGGASGAVADISAAALAMAAADNPNATMVSRNPIASLGLALAAADWSGKSGAVDLSALLPKLPLTPVRLVLSSLPGGSATDTLDSVAPQGLTLHQGAALLLAGAMPDGRIALAISDPARQVAAHPRLELAILSPSTLAPLLVLASASLDPSGAAVTVSGKSIPLARIDPALATRLVSGAGVLFVDQVPLQPKGASTPVLTVDPIVPVPDPGVVTGAASVGRSADGRILALDSSGTAVGRAEYIGGVPPWDWLGSDGLDWTLREMADAIGWRVGVELTGYEFDLAPWQKIVRAQFNQATAEWGVDWATSEPAQGQFSFTVLERLVVFATSCGMRVRGHPLVCNSQVPPWVTAAGHSSSAMKSALENHVATLVSQYRGRVAEWVVVNEPYLPPYRTDDPLHAALAYDYIDLAFAAARNADPSAVLIYNDTENHSSDGLTTALTRTTVRRLKAKGLVDAVGLEMHLDGDNPPAEADVAATMQSYGLPVFVTEFDIDLSNVRGTTVERFATQAQIAASMLRAARGSGVCRSFTLWGIGDAYSWLVFALGRAHADGTPFDGNLKPKPFFTALLDGFK